MSCKFPYVIALIVCAGILSITAASTAAPSPSDIATARALMSEGRAKMAAKQYAVAREKFKAAHDIMHVPTTALHLAQAEEALGLLVEAQTTAVEVRRMPAAASEPEAFTKARARAAELTEQLATRIPTLEITINAATNVKLVVTIDGSPVQSSTLRFLRKVNPGEHAVVVTARGHSSERRVVRIEEGQTVPVEITLRRAGPVPSASTSSTLRIPLATNTSASAVRTARPAWPWISGGAGIAALSVGIGFAVELANAKEALYERCPDTYCKPGVTLEESQALRDRWNRAAGMTGAFIPLGGIAVGFGIGGIVWRPSATQQSIVLTPVPVPWVGSGRGGVTLVGAF